MIADMAIGHEQRQRQQRQDQDLQAQQDAKDQAAHQQLEEGQELSPEQAGHLQPQLGNAALAALLARSGPGSGGVAGLEEEGHEELVEAQDEEELHAEELEAPIYGGGGGGGPGGPGGPADPWDMGKLFGGDDDDDVGTGGARNPRLRPSPLRPGDGPLDDEPEDDPEAIDPEHLAEVNAALPPAPPSPPGPRTGDAVHRAVEGPLSDAAHIARGSLSPEDLVAHGGGASPLGRPLAIGRFLAQHGTQVRARALGRALAGGASLLLVPATGTAGAVARLATMAVCAQVAEGGGAATDRAIALALATDAWPRAMFAARQLARRRRLHAPHIAARALGAALSDRDSSGAEELPRDSLGGRALASLIPTRVRIDIPGLQMPRIDPVSDDESTAAVDALLAELTGGRDPRALPADPIVDIDALQPVLDAAGDLVNDLGRAQVEFAAAGVAACRVESDAPVRQALVHGDRALRLLAREVVSAGEALAELRGTPRPGSAARAAPLLQIMRDTVDGLDALRAWVFGTIAAAAVRLDETSESSAPASTIGVEAEATRAGGDRVGARALLEQELASAREAGDPVAERELSLLLGAASMEAGQAHQARDAFERALLLSTSTAQDTATTVAAGSPLAGILLAEGRFDQARQVAVEVRQAAAARSHWLAMADATIVIAAADLASSALADAVAELLGSAVQMRTLGAHTAAQLLKARLAEYRAELGAERFDAALQQATASMAH